MFTKILYYFIILPISILPYWVLYLISDFLYLVLYKISKYRTEVVFNNLKNSFPNKSDIELKKIMSDFYHHLCDLIVESLKGFTISEKQIKKRLTIINPELCNDYYKKKQNIILVGGHINNWEICAQGVPFIIPHDNFGIYKPLSNKFFDNKMITTRGKFGTSLVSMKQTKKTFQEKGDNPRSVIFGSDQSPSNPKRAYWLDFLNQETAVLFGAEKYSKEYDLPIIYVSIYKIKRGFYTVKCTLISDKPKEESYGVITEKYTKEIEKDIIAKPEFWLWSHKRWKHKKSK